MGMAPTPEQLASRRAIIERSGEQEGPKPMIEGEIPVLHPLFKSKISNLIYGISWTFNKQILDQAEILCNNERTWEIVRRNFMRNMKDQIETLQRTVGQEVRELQLKAKETTDELES